MDGGAVSTWLRLAHASPQEPIPIPLPSSRQDTTWEAGNQTQWKHLHQGRGTLLFLKKKRARRLCFWPHHAACGVLAPRWGTEPGAMAVKVLNPKPWSAGELLRAHGYTFSSTPLQEHLPTGLAQKSIRVFLLHLTKKSKWATGPTQYKRVRQDEEDILGGTVNSVNGEFSFWRLEFENNDVQCLVSPQVTQENSNSSYTILTFFCPREWSGCPGPVLGILGTGDPVWIFGTSRGL